MVITGIEVNKQLIDKNYTKGIFIKPKYIVIHDTNNIDFGSNAKFNRDYLSVNHKAKFSSHYIVDDKTVIQLLEDNWRGWHVGDVSNPKITNSNSLAIMMCINRGANLEKTMTRMLLLTKALMSKHGIKVENVIRHYDVTNKKCPKIMLEDNPSLWVSFKESLVENKNKVDISRIIGKVTLNDALTEINVKAKRDRKSENIGTVNHRDEVNIYEVKDDWAKVVIDNQFGYIKYSFMSKLDEKSNRVRVRTLDPVKLEGDIETPVRKVTNDFIKKKNDSIKVSMREEGVVIGTTTNLAVRKGPNASFYVISYLLAGDRVRVIEQQNEWYKIIYQSNRGERAGFVECQYIEVN